MKKLKLLFVLLMTMVLTMPLLSGCFKKEDKQAAEDYSNITIGFSIHGLDMARWKREKTMAEEFAKEKGFNLLVMDAQKDPQKQIEQCENLIYQGVKAIIIIPEDDIAAGKVGEIAKANNVPLIAYDRIVRNAHLDYYINFEQKKVGVLQAKILTEKYPEGNYVLIKGSPTDNNTKSFTDGNMEVLEPFINSGEIKIIDSFDTPGWYRNEAYKFMKEVLAKTTDIQAVLVQNDDMGRAVIQALDESGLAGKVGVTGQDADLDSIKYILEDKQTMTVYKPLKTMNQAAFNFALDLAKGKKPETNGITNNGYMDVPTYFIDVVAVTKDNIDSTVIQDGFYTKEEVYGKQN
ncbi:MAG: sugar ABC transporter substrate-binding protein [Candidatus Gastranaerophilales bacterium]|nr:sugar ABC transporter substrate-binding protein [Candidatus Gastranaerophilales bacterium]